MVTTKDQRNIVIKPQGHLETGKGEAVIEHLLTPEQMNDKCSLFAHIVLKPGCAIAYHQHLNESETYYILSGEGMYNDNGTMIPVKPGHVTFTDDKESHGLENTGEEDLVFAALIIKG